MRFNASIAIALTAFFAVAQTISEPALLQSIRARTRSGSNPNLKSINIYSAGVAIYYRIPIMEIDFDGAPNAYHPPIAGYPHGRGPGLGLDDLRNASNNLKDDSTAQWRSIVTDAGVPITQKDGPFAGFYISTTSLQDKRFSECDPRRYVDATKVPYVVLNPSLTKLGLEVGDLAVVMMNRDDPKIVYGIVADVGPPNGLGEVSKSLANSMGMPSGAEGIDVLFIFFPTPANRKVRTLDQIQSESAKLFADWGGSARAKALP